MYHLLLCFILYLLLNTNALTAPQKAHCYCCKRNHSSVCNEKTDSGIQLDIIKAALVEQGVSNIVVIYMSNKRVEQQLHSGGVDILA
ncbi:hypothetical protein ACOBV8_20320 (plasmid) [Pseudoalteromonas espejiana]